MRPGLVFYAELARSLSVEREGRRGGHVPGASPFRQVQGQDASLWEGGPGKP